MEDLSNVGMLRQLKSQG